MKCEYCNTNEPNRDNRNNCGSCGAQLPKELEQIGFGNYDPYEGIYRVVIMTPMEVKT